MERVINKGEALFAELVENPALDSGDILNSFVQYMSDDQLYDFCIQLKKDFDID